MKKARLLGGILLTSIILLSFFNDTGHSGKYESSRYGTAIIMTGAAARISQQAALLETLYNRGELEDVVFISGVSAGAINAVVLNGVIEGKITWEDYRKILFNLKNQDIFRAAADNKLPVDTEPVRNLFRKIVEDSLGYYQIGDLPVTSEISFRKLPNLDFKKRNYRMCSRKINPETDTTLSLVDILMASSAIPIAFPPVRIGNSATIPDTRYVDGGIGPDMVPFQGLLEYQDFMRRGVSKVYIIGRKSATYFEVSDELKNLGIDTPAKFENLGLSLDRILRRVLINRLEAFARKAPEMIMVSYVWIPDFEKDFAMLNFDSLEEQYYLTIEWAEKNPPVSLGDFLLYNRYRKKED